MKAKNLFDEINNSPIFEGCICLHNIEYGFEDNLEGEIDILIQKDDMLYLMEIKSTYDRVTVKEISKHREDLIYAGHQLERAKNWFFEHPKEITKRTKRSVEIDKLEIRTLIVSTSFEYDHEYFSKSLKISLLELYIALYNDIGSFIITPQYLLNITKQHNSVLYEKYFNLSVDEKYRIQDCNIEFIKELTEIVEMIKEYKPIKDDIGKKSNLYPDSHTVDDFTRIIESNEIWIRVMNSMK